MQQMVDFLSKYAIKCYKTKGWYKGILELKNYVAFSWFVGAIGVEIAAESCSWLWQSIDMCQCGRPIRMLIGNP